MNRDNQKAAEARYAFETGVDPDPSKLSIDDRLKLVHYPPRTPGTHFEYPDGTRYTVAPDGSHAQHTTKFSKAEIKRQRKLRRQQMRDEA